MDCISVWCVCVGMCVCVCVMCVCVMCVCDVCVCNVCVCDVCVCVCDVCVCDVCVCCVGGGVGCVCGWVCVCVGLCVYLIPEISEERRVGRRCRYRETVCEGKSIDITVQRANNSIKSRENTIQEL